MRWADRSRTGPGRFALAWLLMTLAAAQAPALQLAPAVTASLWSERDGVEPGRPFTLGLRLLHAPGWHSYWTVPGDSGLPTRLTCRLPRRADPVAGSAATSDRPAGRLRL